MEKNWGDTPSATLIKNERWNNIKNGTHADIKCFHFVD